jgi:multiple sugar transport system permease protein
MPGDVKIRAGLYADRSPPLARHPFLGDPVLAFGSVVAASVWQWIPFTFLTVLAALEMLPPEPYEAARVDGAGAWQSFRYLTLPFLVPVLLVLAFFRFAAAVKIFDKVYVMTGGRPGTATEMVANYIHRQSLVHFRLGEAGASGVLLLVAVLAVGALFLHFIVRDDH